MSEQRTPPRDEVILRATRDEIRRRPGAASRAIYEAVAARIPRLPVTLDVRQFHGRYVTVIKAGLRREREAEAEARRERMRAELEAEERSMSVLAAEDLPPEQAVRVEVLRARLETLEEPGVPERGGRDRAPDVRAILLELVGEAVRAETRADVVRVVQRIDRYAERIRALG